MPKIVAILRKRPEISMEEFKEHYENSHAPLILEQARPFIVGYTRSYLNYEDPHCIFGDAKFGECRDGAEYFPHYDVITELEFEDHRAMEAYFAAGQDPELAQRKAADELKFLVREERLIVVSDDVRSSEI